MIRLVQFEHGAAVMPVQGIPLKLQVVMQRAERCFGKIPAGQANHGPFQLLPHKPRFFDQIGVDQRDAGTPLRQHDEQPLLRKPDEAFPDGRSADLKSDGHLFFRKCRPRRELQSNNLLFQLSINMVSGRSGRRACQWFQTITSC
ncbi:hypothetical protein D1872_251440 [compost metagenome]